MDPIGEYSGIVKELITKIEKEEKGNIREAAEVISDKIKQEKIIHVFGPGHGAMVAEELFFRAGGLVPINPILDSALSLRQVKKCVEVEHIEGYTKHNLDYYDVKEDDVLIIANYVAVEPSSVSLALEAKDRGVTVIGITSTEFCDSIPENSSVRHSSKKDLSDISDVFIDTHVPTGDGAVKIEGLEQKVSPVSTILQSFIVNSLVAQTVKNLVDDDVEPPILMSTSLPGAEENNEKYLDKYSDRIEHL